MHAYKAWTQARQPYGRDEVWNDPINVVGKVRASIATLWLKRLSRSAKNCLPLREAFSATLSQFHCFCASLAFLTLDLLLFKSINDGPTT